jgi:hypothetical protein
MALSEQERLFLSLFRTSGGPQVYSWEGWLTDSALSLLNKTKLEAEAYVEGNAHRLWNAFRKANDDYLRVRNTPALIVVEDENRLFRIPGPDDAKDRREKEVLRDRNKVIQFIDGSGHRKFEYIGAILAISIGAKRTYVTPSGNERGVDFYAEVPIWGSSRVFHSPHNAMRIVGQSKFYSSKIEFSKSKEFVGVLSDIRHRNPEIVARGPKWFYELQGPIVGIIVSACGFQSGSIQQCQEHGVLYADTIDVAHTIAGSRWFRSIKSRNGSVQDALAAAIRDYVNTT